MKNAVWIDKRKAWVLRIEDKGEFFENVESRVEDKQTTGGYGGKVPYEGQVAFADDKVQRKEDDQLKRYYDELIDRIKDSEELLIEGPSEAKLGLMKRIREYAQYKDMRIELRNADSMSENQFRAGVKAYFSKP